MTLILFLLVIILVVVLVKGEVTWPVGKKQALSLQRADRGP
jgi:hypothetical protein